MSISLSRIFHLRKGELANENHKAPSNLKEATESPESASGRSEQAKRAEALMIWLARNVGGLKAGEVAKNTYIVGGSVRDYLLGKDPKDIDVVIDAVALNGFDSEKLAHAIMRISPASFSLATNLFGVSIMTVKSSWRVPTLDGEIVDLKGEDIEIATARSEMYDEGGYKPVDVEAAPIELDVYRREFNFNTLMWRLSDLVDGPDGAPVIDITGRGLSDLRSGIMDTPDDPVVTFTDDPSRMVRAVKFGARYNWHISPRVVETIHQNAHLLKNVPHGKLSDLLLKQILPLGANAFERLSELRLNDVLGEIYNTTPPFKAAIDGWLRLASPVELVKMHKAGMPFELPWENYFESGFEFEEFNETLPRSRNPAWTVEVLGNPTKGVADPKWFLRTADVLGLSKRDLKVLGSELKSIARTLLTINPDMANNPHEFRVSVEELLGEKFGVELNSDVEDAG